MGISSESYGTLLTSILMNKIPAEIRLVVTRQCSGTHCEIQELMEALVYKEIDAREQSSGHYQSSTGKPFRGQPTASVLVANSTTPDHCVYCGQEHQSNSCVVIVDVGRRKEILCKNGRCYVCLKKYHTSRDCRSRGRCTKCNGRHHTTICLRSSSQSSPLPNPEKAPSINTMYAGSQTAVLLQTARLRLTNFSEASPINHVARAVLDSGSQRTYVTQRIKDELQLPTRSSEFLRIKTFGSTGGHDAQCEVVSVGIVANNGETLVLNALVVPFICNPLTFQPISLSRESHDHLDGLELADAASAEDTLEIDVLIGSDSYWNLVTGRVIRGRCGPIAIQTKVGWVLSGPAEQQEAFTNLTFNAAHTLTICTSPVNLSLDDQLRQFWNLESIGVMKDEPPVYERFVQQIKFNGERYQVSLPWRDTHLPLPTNFSLCYKRLINLLRKLGNEPTLLNDYNQIIQDQIKSGIVEVVTDSTSVQDKLIHYLPHHGVVRQDKTTSRLHIVYDASAKIAGSPSLNECLYTGPSFGQSIFDILLRFRAHRIVLTGDIEKAFLMIAVEEKDRDVLRFLWTSNFNNDEPEIMILRFARVVFGVSCSPFLLNATINHHMETYRDVDPQFVDKFLSSIYVDDVSLGSNNVETTYELYLKSKLRLAQAGFKLRKFVTNSEELRQLIRLNEHSELTTGGEIHRMLGVEWKFTDDNLLFNIENVTRTMMTAEPTKRSVVSMTAKFFDPLGIISPVIVLFKMFFQDLCESRIDWDEPLSGDLLNKWNQLRSAVSGSTIIVVPRCYFNTTLQNSATDVKIIGFCDASSKAYAAVVYLRLEFQERIIVSFIAAKSRVAPLKTLTIPRLELLSALLLSKLVVNIQAALHKEFPSIDIICYTDSRVALCWIQGCRQEWKQFVENRVRSIRSLVPPQAWRHCPGIENPADIPSRGVSISELVKSELWLYGPKWLRDTQGLLDNIYCTDDTIPEQCCQEMRKCTTQLLAGNSASEVRIGLVIRCEDFSSFHKLLRITGLVIKFLRILSARKHELNINSISLGNTELARLYWIKDSQLQLTQDPKFPAWKNQFNLFCDELQIWRCGGRMSNADLSSSAQALILLNKKHHLTTLIVTDAHHRILHGGVKDTLTELRSAYWLIRGRQFIRQLIHRCVVCRRQEGRPYQGVISPPLPEYRVRRSRPFQYTGVDFAGPLYIKQSTALNTTKVWLCLYTCAVTRAVHLDLVSDMNASTFIRSFQRFTARRGIPNKIISDNGKTFKSASKSIHDIIYSPNVRTHLNNLQLEWTFNLERAPWWGGMFERLIGSTKRCLRKVLGRASLSYDELLTLVIEVEAVLNSRPLSYVSTEDLDEPLTPSHLLVGYRILS